MEAPGAIFQVFLMVEWDTLNQEWFLVDVVTLVNMRLGIPASPLVEDNGQPRILFNTDVLVTPPGHQHSMAWFLWGVVMVILGVAQKC